MQYKFKRHQQVRLKSSPNAEYVEYHESFEGSSIKPGMKAKINLIMSNGQYHVEIFNDKDELIAYALMHEEELE